MMQLKACCIVGNPYEQVLGSKEGNIYYTELKFKLKERIVHLIEDFSVTHFIIGMNIGTEQYAAEIILDLKKVYPKITIEGVIPYETYASNWTELQRNRYYSIMKNIDKETLLQYRYTHDCIKKHMNYIIKNSNYILTVSNGSTSCIDKLISIANSKGKIVFCIDMSNTEVRMNSFTKLYKYK